MATMIRETDIDVQELRDKLSPQHIDEALEHANGLMQALWPLKTGYPEGSSPEILRAVFLVQQALEDAL